MNVNGYVRTTDRGETEISFGTEVRDRQIHKEGEEEGEKIKLIDIL